MSDSTSQKDRNVTSGDGSEVQIERDLDRLAMTDDEVARLTGCERQYRVEELIEESHGLLVDGIERHVTGEGNREGERWKLTTWLDGDDAEGFTYNHGSFDSALSGARCFADYVPDEDDNRKARAWEVRNPDGDAVDFWVADGVCPECKVGDVMGDGPMERDTDHHPSRCSERCGWSS